MSLNSLSAEPRYAPGIDLSSRALLRISVALLGLRITFAQIGELGWPTAAMVAAAVPLTIGFGWTLARLLKHDGRFGVLSGSAVGICGASAAMAVAVAWPRENAERDTVVVIACITAMSTVAMVFYPVAAGYLHLSPLDTGRFLGGAIHDVAQVVGAGYAVGQKTGDVATIVKLMRVAMLLPVVLLITLTVARRTRESPPGEKRVALVPGFLIAFVALAVLHGVGAVPASVAAVLGEVSKWLRVIAVAALGMKTSARELIVVGRSALGLVFAETMFIGLFVLGWMQLLSAMSSN
jgi:uncharacterized integral membrane protein (TIGR00698 family)